MSSGLKEDLKRIGNVNGRDMDFGCITPPYIHRMWGGRFSIEEIEKGLTEIRKQGFMG